MVLCVSEGVNISEKEGCTMATRGCVLGRKANRGVTIGVNLEWQKVASSCQDDLM